MAKFTVVAPTQYTGLVCDVLFKNGIAEVDTDTHRAAYEYFRKAGYSVEPADAPEPEEDSDETEDAGTKEPAPAKTTVRTTTTKGVAK